MQMRSIGLQYRSIQCWVYFSLCYFSLCLHSGNKRQAAVTCDKQQVVFTVKLQKAATKLHTLKIPGKHEVRTQKLKGFCQTRT